MKTLNDCYRSMSVIEVYDNNKYCGTYTDMYHVKLYMPKDLKDKALTYRFNTITEKYNSKLFFELLLKGYHTR